MNCLKKVDFQKMYYYITQKKVAVISLKKSLNIDSFDENFCRW